MIITKKSISRRAVMKGAGAVLALPVLDAMTPAFAAAPAPSPKRLSFVTVPNGIIMDGKYNVPPGQWTPTATGTDFEMPRTISPIARYRENMIIPSGLDQAQAEPLDTDSGGMHSRSTGAILTGTHARQTAGADIHAGISADRVAAREFGKYTQYGSIGIGLESAETLGACENDYACAYTTTISWDNATTPLPLENRPRALFERLFGDMAADPKTRLARTKQQGSILDAVSEDVRRLQGNLGGADRGKMEQYLDAVRDTERRVQLAEAQANNELPASAKSLTIEGVTGIPAQFSDHYKLMADLAVLAQQTNLTRVIAFQVGHGRSTRSYPEIGILDGHHPLTHHRGEMDPLKKVVKINTYHVEMLGYYLDKLRSTPDGDGSLLDHSMVLHTGALSDANLHLYTDLPMVLIAGKKTGIKGGQHIRYPKGTPMTNLLLTMLDTAGVPHVPSLGDSTGRLPLPTQTA